jgi:hypothetical protein
LQLKIALVQPQLLLADKSAVIFLVSVFYPQQQTKQIQEIRRQLVCYIQLIVIMVVGLHHLVLPDHQVAVRLAQEVVEVGVVVQVQAVGAEVDQVLAQVVVVVMVEAVISLNLTFKSIRVVQE